MWAWYCLFLVLFFKYVRPKSSMKKEQSTIMFYTRINVFTDAYYKQNNTNISKISSNILPKVCNWRDVQRNNVLNNVDTSSLRAPWQNGPYKNNTEQHKNT